VIQIDPCFKNYFFIFFTIQGGKVLKHLGLWDIKLKPRCPANIYPSGGQNIVSTFVNNGFDNILLTIYGINGYDTSFNFNGFNQFRNSSYFIVFLLGYHMFKKKSRF